MARGGITNTGEPMITQGADGYFHVQIQRKDLRKATRIKGLDRAVEWRDRWLSGLAPLPQFDTIEQWLGRMIPDNNDLGQRAGHVRRRRYKTRGLQRKEMVATGLIGIDKKTHPFEFKHSLVSRDEIAAKFGKLLLAKTLVGKTMPIVWNVDPKERPDFRPLQRALARFGIALMTVPEFKATL